jgi:hypothetical protein
MDFIDAGLLPEGKDSAAFRHEQNIALIGNKIGYIQMIDTMARCILEHMRIV